VPNVAIPQIIANAANANGVPPALALAVASRESSLNPAAVGSAGEQGLFQLMPGTAKQYNVGNPFDPAENADGGTAYLADLYAQYGNWPAALTAYNWGPGNFAAAGNNVNAAPASTQAYVSSILGSAALPAQVTVTPSSIASGTADLFANDNSTPFADSADALVTDPSLLDASAADAGAGGPNWVMLALIALGVYIAFDVLEL
jgi:hypothetical protein